MSNYSKATTTIILRKLNSAEKREDQTLKSVNIRIRFIGKTNDWALGIKVCNDDFNKIKEGQRLSTELREIRNQMLSFKSKADKICNDLGEDFTKEKFKQAFFNKKNIIGAHMAVQSVIIEYCENRVLSIKTKKGYSTLSNHMSNFKRNINLHSIDSLFLIEFKTFLKSRSMTDPSIGIYLRYLKSIYNYALLKRYITGEQNPFNGFKIQNSKNKKRPLTKETLKLLYEYKTNCSKKEKARDFFLFSYVSNGINFKDICLLKFEDINEDIISFKRQKTKNTASSIINIEFLLTPTHYKIINRWCDPENQLQNSGYIFPILNNCSTEIEMQNKIDQFIKNTNKYLKIISIELGLKSNFTTVYARHSFATILKNGNMSDPIIGEALGHQNIKTTKLYFSKSDRDTLQQISDTVSLN